MPNDELLQWIGRKLWYYHTGAIMSKDDHLPKEYLIHANELLAKLKDMGYVKWDREKVANMMMTPMPKASLGEKYRFNLELADQLKEKLTGGK